MRFLLLLALVVMVRGDTAPSDDIDLNSDEFIDLINSKNSTWRAGRNFPKDTLMEFLKGLAGVHMGDAQDVAKAPPIEHHVDIPDSFDARERWPDCPSVKEIRNQGHCGSCWAFGSVEAITDRTCIHSNGTSKPHLSAGDVVFCCKKCGGGCKGGSPYLAWDYWITDGIVTGGPPKSKQGCKPYDLKVQTCKKECIPGYPISYENDKHFGSTYYVIKKNVTQMQMEILKNGPVTVGFTVYNDFFHYKKGVYRHTTSRGGGIHVVKMLGWGVEDGTPYWLIANSWGVGFGEKGFFKILRGQNECNIEHAVVGGFPRL